MPSVSVCSFLCPVSAGLSVLSFGYFSAGEPWSKASESWHKVHSTQRGIYEMRKIAMLSAAAAISAFAGCILSSTAWAGTLCPDGSFVASGSCQMTPNGGYVSGNNPVQVAPNGAYTSGQPQMTPNGGYVGQGPMMMCPDGSYSASGCQLQTNGKYGR